MPPPALPLLSCDERSAPGSATPKARVGGSIVASAMHSLRFRAAWSANATESGVRAASTCWNARLKHSEKAENPRRGAKSRFVNLVRSDPREPAFRAPPSPAGREREENGAERLRGDGAGRRQRRGRSRRAILDAIDRQGQRKGSAERHLAFQHAAARDLRQDRLEHVDESDRTSSGRRRSGSRDEVKARLRIQAHLRRYSGSSTLDEPLSETLVRTDTILAHW